MQRALNRSAEALSHCRGSVLAQPALKDFWNMSGTNRMVRKLTLLFKRGGNGRLEMKTHSFSVLEFASR